MMARYRIHPAVTFLISTFAPACPTRLRGWKSTLEKRGERIALTFDLPDPEAMTRARKLVRQADALRLVRVGGKTIHECAGAIDGDVLTISALLRRN